MAPTRRPGAPTGRRQPSPGTRPLQTLSLGTLNPTPEVALPRGMPPRQTLPPQTPPLATIPLEVLRMARRRSTATRKIVDYSNDI